MRTPCCQASLAFILKFLNFLQTFIGLSIVMYSVYMLNQWSHHHHRSAISPPSIPSPDAIRVSDHLNLAVGVVSGFDDGLGLNSLVLPTPWFIYAFMGMGIVVCCISFVGHVAAEAINGCCLCFYTLLTAILVLLEAALVGFIAFDHHWQKDLPFDPTGELDSIRAFIEDNIDICRWIGIVVLIIQALTLLIALILRAMVSSQRADPDIEGNYDVVRGKNWEPLLNPQPSETSGSVKSDGRGFHSDIWSSRIREKYGLNNGEVKQNLLNQSTPINIKSKQ